MLFSFYINLAGSIANGLMLLYVVRYHIYSRKIKQNFYSILLTSVFLLWNASEFFRIFDKPTFQLVTFSIFAFFVSVTVAFEISTFLDMKKLYWIEFVLWMLGGGVFLFFEFTGKDLILFSSIFFTLNSSLTVFCFIFEYFHARSFSRRNKIILNVLYYLGFFAFEAIVIWSYPVSNMPASYFIISNSLILPVYLYILMTLTYGKNVGFSVNFFKNALYGALGSAVISIFFIVGYYMNSYFAGRIGIMQSFFINFVLVFFVFLAFSGYLKKLDMLLEKITRMGTYYYRESMMKFIRKALKVDNLEELSKLVSDYLMRMVNSSDVEIFFMNDDGNFVSAKRKVGKECFEGVPKFVKIVDLYALGRKPNILRGKEFLIWIKSVEKTEGCMVLGCKRFGRYTSTDMEIIDIISNQVALFMSRYRSIERVRKAERRMLLQERMAALGRLAFGVAHEIRNPLNVISTSLQMMDEDGSQREKLKTYIQEEIVRINEILENFLDFARQKPKSLEEVNLNELIEKTVLLLKESALKRGINIEENLPSKPVFAKIDKNMMMEVLLNLGTNSLDAVNDGGKIRFELKKEKDHFSITISNNGEPIPEEKMDLIFEPFYTTKEHGTGLGLAIVYNYVQSMGGSISVKSDTTQTSFGVKIPLEVKS